MKEDKVAKWGDRAVVAVVLFALVLYITGVIA